MTGNSTGPAERREALQPREERTERPGTDDTPPDTGAVGEVVEATDDDVAERVQARRRSPVVGQAVADRGHQHRPPGAGGPEAGDQCERPVVPGERGTGLPDARHRTLHREPR